VHRPELPGTAAAGALGGLDILVNNAGIGAVGSVEDNADEVAEAVAYLAGPAARSVTGVALAVDGGMAGLRLRPAGS
jgi:NAD(P)-dependent dehydrogenase (short-subunit alcohol dehydrogenase family)